MRRTRHVVLPVRSWQYIGLLIVSLACLTLGLVSRDREGHSGSLAGPELTHQAPHEVDACPNLNPFAKLSAHLITEPEGVTKPINDHEIKVPKSPTSRRLVLSRSLSLGRLSRIGSQEIEERSSRNLRAIERLSRSRTRVSDNESINRLRESRFRTTAESRNARNSFDSATRLSRSQDLSNRATDRRSTVRDYERRVADHMNSRSRVIRERREFNEIAHRQNRRNSPNLQPRTNDRRSLSMERRGPSEMNRQESRDVPAGRREYRDLTRTRTDHHRSEMRERRSRSVERGDAERLNHREDRKSLLKTRSENTARGDIDRNNNLNRRSRERTLEARRALLDRVTNQERRSRVSIVTRNSRGDLVRSNDRRLQSRSMERINDFDRETLNNRRVRSVESNIERSSERRLSSERRSLARSTEMNRIEHRRVEMKDRFTGRRSLDRMTSRVSSEDVRRERINRSQRIVSQRDSRGNAARENFRTIPARSLYNVEDISSRERREGHVRPSRSVDRNSMYRRELAKIKESRDRRSHDSSTERRDLTLERRERTNRRVYRSREERRIVPQQSREEVERRVSRRVSPERRVLERRDTLDRTRLDSRRSSERKIDENARSREASRMADRRLERNPELRISHGRILEKRSAVNSRKSFERRIDDSSRSREGSRMQDRRVERNSELRDTISMRVMDRRANRAAAYEKRVLIRSLEKRSDARRVRDLEERRVARSVENRLAESSERDSIRQLRHRSSNLNVKDSSRLASLRRVIRASRVPEQNRERRTLSARERMVSRIASNDRLSAKWERNLQDASVETIGVKIVPKSMDYELFKYPMTYDFMRQAFVLALCTVYGLSLYNGKKTIIGNMMQQMQRFIVW